MSTTKPTYETLTPENVRAGLRICAKAGGGQDRIITGIYRGQEIACTGVASGRSTFVAWRSLSRYRIVGRLGS